MDYWQQFFPVHVLLWSITAKGAVKIIGFAGECDRIMGEAGKILIVSGLFLFIQRSEPTDYSESVVTRHFFDGRKVFSLVLWFLCSIFSRMYIIGYLYARLDYMCMCQYREKMVLALYMLCCCDEGACVFRFWELLSLSQYVLASMCMCVCASAEWDFSQSEGVSNLTESNGATGSEKQWGERRGGEGWAMNVNTRASKLDSFVHICVYRAGFFLVIFALECTSVCVGFGKKLVRSSRCVKVKVQYASLV